MARSDISDLISVIIPAYNAGKYLAEAIESVQAQSYKALDIIVVDDGSTDDTAVVAGTFDVRYIHQENTGISGAMNTGFEAAEGAYLSSLDADDLWLPDKLSIQIKALQDQPELDMVFAHVEQFICPRLKDIEHQPQLPERSRILAGYTSQSMLIRRDSFFRVGLFNAEFQIGDFLEWYARSQEAGLLSKMLPEVLSRRRIHDTNTGVTKKNSQSDYLRILKASLDRRRGTEN